MRIQPEITDPALTPLLTWIDSYTSWEKLSERTRTDLARRAHLGDAGAIEAMCNHNLRLVLSRAVKKMGRGVPLADLIQEGWLGLRIAAQRYDLRRGTRFSTMATHWIDQKLNYALVVQGRTIYLPHHATEKLARIARCAVDGAPIVERDQTWLDKLAGELSGNPDLRNVSIFAFDHLTARPTSLDKHIGEGTHVAGEHYHTLADMIPAPSQPDISDTLDLEALLVAMVNDGSLTRREGWLVVRHYGLDGAGGRAYTEMARELRDAEVRAGLAPEGTRPLSRERIRQLIAGALTKIRLHVRATWQSDTEGVQYKEQEKGSHVPQSPAKVKSTESPKTRSTRRTSVNDSLKESAASRAAAPLSLRAHDSTNGAKRSSQGRTGASRGSDVPYAEAI